ncbi:ATP-grasp fold amidoligase family protein [Vibrio sp. 10N.222.49.C12]|uniref:ATP-grasp fold amidoligase family protein n=1 Tax=Vibrio sp. 10N.222.49.C12 TaxID=3229614 RepID=UPI003552C4AF
MLKKYISAIGEQAFIKKMYRSKHGRELDLNRPIGFSEKLAWTKLYDKNSLMTICADKHLVRSYVESRVGDRYLIPQLGVYNKFSEIDFSKLDTPYVLKVNHTSGGNCFDLEKKPLSLTKAKKELEHYMKLNAYYFACEWAYKDIKPKIVAERVILDENGKLPNDYKIFCFNGKPKFIQVDISRFENHRRDFYDLEWVKLDYKFVYDNSLHGVKRPENLDEMLEIATKLSQEFNFARVDLYEIRGKIYFGEITFYPEGGSKEFSETQHEHLVGDYLKLSLNS